MIAGQAFGIPDSHAAEVIRRLRENDQYVRQTRSIRNRPKATARHLANLVAALMTGASSRTAPDALKRVERCRISGNALQKLFFDDPVNIGDDFTRYFNDSEWSKHRPLDPINKRAPFHKIVIAARDTKKSARI